MSEEIVRQWLNAIVTTVEARDIKAHMNLISQRVTLRGVPGFETIGYADWYRQCEHEFANGVIKGIKYEGYKQVAATADRIVFKTYETVMATDGNENAQGVEILLEKEADGQWRLVEERLLPHVEAARDQLIPA
ncbi:MAG: nuclear transport factor 2 family protein [Gammaproteobacteria bacterium]|nr:nuclear transport factor 2 family protein [Gammaproteobacteria bacterium]